MQNIKKLGNATIFTEKSRKKLLRFQRVGYSFILILDSCHLMFKHRGAGESGFIRHKIFWN